MLRRSFLKAAPVLGLLGACGKPPLPKTRLALNWKPDPQFGGFYAAPYSAHNIDIEILPGGAGTPTIQMIGAGSAEFGIVSADELVVARSRGNDVVALFAVFQNNPQGIMVHSSRKTQSLADVFNGGTLAIQRGLPYARLLEKKYGFGRVKIVPSPGGDITAFLHDPNFAQQCFVMSEPLTARHQGVDVTVYPISDSGYNPYTTVLAVAGDLLRKDPELAVRMIASVRTGWISYLADPLPVNRGMNQLNPSMPLDVFAEVAAAQRPLIETDQTHDQHLGLMTSDRWKTLISQLKGLGDIKENLIPEECFKQY